MMLIMAFERALRSGLLLLLAACASPPPTYVQTPGSRAAFALVEQVQGGRRGDLPGAARAAGLVEAGICREVGPERLYCNALRVTQVTYYDSFVAGVQAGLYYEELRACLAPRRVVGFVSRGTDGAVPVPLAREYPEEWVSLLPSPVIEVQSNPSFAEVARLYPEVSITDLPVPVAVAVRRLGYGGPGSRFVESAPGTFVAVDYPGHEPGERACRAL